VGSERNVFLALFSFWEVWSWLKVSSANEVVWSSPDAVLILPLQPRNSKNKIIPQVPSQSLSQFIFHVFFSREPLLQNTKQDFHSPIPHASLLNPPYSTTLLLSPDILFEWRWSFSETLTFLFFCYHPVGVPWSFRDKCRNCRHWMAVLARLKIHWCELRSEISGSENSLSYSH
jgi:hypothetical protein